MECDKVSFAMSRADMEDQTSIKVYPIRQLVEELSSQAPRFQSSGGMAWHGMACSPAAPNKGRVLAFGGFFSANSKTLLGQRRLRMDAGLRACSARSFSSKVTLW
jgi:hypothetical protein